MRSKRKPKDIGHGVLVLGFGSPEANADFRERLIEIARQTRLTTTQIFQAFCSELSDQIDPINANGEVYLFPEHRQRMIYLTKPVPAPDARVNLHRCANEAMYDIESVNYLLDHRLDCPWGYDEIKLMMSICVNQRDWATFWSVRSFNAERREQFADEARTWDEQAQRLEARLEKYEQVEHERIVAYGS